MASAQMFKAGGFWGRALKAHEFVNYYDPPSTLFDEETWGVHRQVDHAIDFAMKGIEYQEDGTCPIEEPECAPTPVNIAELLFEMRAMRESPPARRTWNIFLCVDVSG